MVTIPEDLNSLKYKDLRELATKLGLKPGFAKKEKIQEMIEQVRNSQGELPENPTPSQKNGVYSFDPETEDEDEIQANAEENEKVMEANTKVKASKRTKDGKSKSKGKSRLTEQEKQERAAERAKVKAEKKERAKKIREVLAKFSSEYSDALSTDGPAGKDPEKILAMWQQKIEKKEVEVTVEELNAAASKAKVKFNKMAGTLTDDHRAILNNKDLTKSDKIRKLYKAGGLSKAQIARVTKSHYSFAFSVIEKFQGRLEYKELSSKLEKTE